MSPGQNRYLEFGEQGGDLRFLSQSGQFGRTHNRTTMFRQLTLDPLPSVRPRGFRGAPRVSTTKGSSVLPGRARRSSTPRSSTPRRWLSVFTVKTPLSPSTLGCRVSGRNPNPKVATRTPQGVLARLGSWGFGLEEGLTWRARRSCTPRASTPRRWPSASLARKTPNLNFPGFKFQTLSLSYLSLDYQPSALTTLTQAVTSQP